MSSKFAGGNDPNNTVTVTRYGTIENVEENIVFSSRHFASHGSRIQPNIAHFHSSRRRQTDEMELENLRAIETKQHCERRVTVGDREGA